MEDCGKQLRRGLLEANHEVAKAEFYHWVLQIAAGMNFLHPENAIYCDLKQCLCKLNVIFQSSNDNDSHQYSHHSLHLSFPTRQNSTLKATLKYFLNVMCRLIPENLSEYAYSMFWFSEKKQIMLKVCL